MDWEGNGEGESTTVEDKGLKIGRHCCFIGGNKMDLNGGQVLSAILLRHSFRLP